MSSFHEVGSIVTHDHGKRGRAFLTYGVHDFKKIADAVAGRTSVFIGTAVAVGRKELGQKLSAGSLKREAVKPGPEKPGSGLRITVAVMTHFLLRHFPGYFSVPRSGNGRRGDIVAFKTRACAAELKKDPASLLMQDIHQSGQRLNEGIIPQGKPPLQPDGRPGVCLLDNDDAGRGFSGAGRMPVEKFSGRIAVRIRGSGLNRSLHEAVAQLHAMKHIFGK